MSGIHHAQLLWWDLPSILKPPGPHPAPRQGSPSQSLSGRPLTPLMREISSSCLVLVPISLAVPARCVHIHASSHTMN
jgi:hypothetical protein